MKWLVPNTFKIVPLGLKNRNSTNTETIWVRQISMLSATASIVPRDLFKRGQFQKKIPGHNPHSISTVYFPIGNRFYCPLPGAVRQERRTLGRGCRLMRRNQSRIYNLQSAETKRPGWQCTLMYLIRKHTKFFDYLVGGFWILYI